MKCGLRPLIHFPETGEGETEMARPNWEYIRIDVLILEHPKVEGLSDKAFRALIELWCYCARQRTDGIVAAPRWRRVPVRVRRELAVAALVDLFLADDESAGVTMHGYLEHQRSREEIEEVSLARSAAGRKGAAKRWEGREA
jgi:hypothetical protein